MADVLVKKYIGLSELFNKYTVDQKDSTKIPKKNHAKNYISILGTPEAVITWGHGERFLTNGTLILNLWDTEYFQVNIYFT